MDADDSIEFGDLRERAPQAVRSPLDDEHYACLPTGSMRPEDLPIFVDLDVFHELENHAASNLQVELGGVLLGRQAVDQNGRPMVLVQDSLRAEHYEATRGSFKFTHSTWSEITRRRARMNDGLEIVGWYHTHPGWGIFLSDLDEFICRNFFGRPLDVALVIDPRQGHRGWFQWTDEGGSTRPVEHWYLFTSRHRQLELRAAVSSLDGSLSGADSLPYVDTGEPAMHHHRPAPPRGMDPVQWSMIWLMGLQTMILGLIAWRLLAPLPANNSGSGAAENLAAEHRVYRELVRDWSVTGGQPLDLADRLARSEAAREQLQQSELSHRARIRELDQQVAELRKPAARPDNQSSKARRDVAEAVRVDKVPPAGGGSATKEFSENAASGLSTTVGSAERGSGAGSDWTWRQLLWLGLGLAGTIAVAGAWWAFRLAGQRNVFPGDDPQDSSAENWPSRPVAGAAASPAPGKAVDPGQRRE